MIYTLPHTPKDFWYLNNGVTVVCDDWDQAGSAGERDVERFAFHGANVVNGAQTVTSIHTAMKRNRSAAEEAEVSIRIISLKGCPSDFGPRVTKATNSQNSVASQDFLALDPNQVRLRKDFALILGKKYSLRSTDKEPLGTDGCTLVEAVTAQACAHPDLQHALTAKNNVGALWKSTSTRPYRELFTAETSAVEVWRRVQVVRRVENALRIVGTSKDDRTYMVSQFGSKIIAHVVLHAFDDVDVADHDVAWDQITEGVEQLAVDVLHHLVDAMDGEKHMKVEVLRNATRARELIQKIAPNLDIKSSSPEGNSAAWRANVSEGLRANVRSPEFHLKSRGINARVPVWKGVLGTRELHSSQQTCPIAAQPLCQSPRSTGARMEAETDR